MDPYSTNRTWLRLSPDGQPSRPYPLQIGDVFKVGSTLFHVLEPSAADSMHAEIRMPAPVDGAVPAPTAAYVEPSPTAAYVEPVRAAPSAPTGLLESTVLEPALPERTSSALQWESFLEGEARPCLSAEEYARRCTASRRRMQQEAGSARRPPVPSGGQQQLQDRELSSLQLRMTNSRAQAAYTTQERRGDEELREVSDEDLCKICYDKAIDVVLYPCGHFMLCRWCAQKVSDCPVCRLVITDIIRTYRA